MSQGSGFEYSLLANTGKENYKHTKIYFFSLFLLGLETPVAAKHRYYKAQVSNIPSCIDAQQ